MGRVHVGDAMITAPTTCALELTVADARELLLDDHVHAVLVVDRGVLVAVVERTDLVGAPAGAAAAGYGRLAGRTVGAHVDVGAARSRMSAGGRRRLAVVDDAGQLLGLLCLRRSGQGFCTDDGVAARGAARAAGLG